MATITTFFQSIPNPAGQHLAPAGHQTSVDMLSWTQTFYAPPSFTAPAISTGSAPYRCFASQDGVAATMSLTQAGPSVRVGETDPVSAALAYLKAQGMSGVYSPQFVTVIEYD